MLALFVGSVNLQQVSIQLLIVYTLILIAFYLTPAKLV